ncbi:DUF6241 domain-containing protein [Ornithinibacillus halophilus]|uniref:Uncharacterized protein n=1 Tax=Ornithinibacillus halophilus TaxID=930117 RepID=A0A1M5L2H1_9BACI|nr:DUF6241 domain-containing protein [Ornithinibacillus halophilus]SHG59135.1 hypothetical protein SAMN05216225_104326 [Ornithinibacillus halophilus]
MKKAILVLLAVFILVGGGTYVLASSAKQEEPKIEPESGNLEEKADDLSEDEFTIPNNPDMDLDEYIEMPKPKYTNVPIDGWSYEKFNKVFREFGDMPTIDDINREIIQMTFQKMDPNEVKEKMKSFPDKFEVEENHPEMNEDNIKFMTLAVENIFDTNGFDNDEPDTNKDNEYYQTFLNEWLNGDFSNLTEVHEELMKDFVL